MTEKNAVDYQCNLLEALSDSKKAMFSSNTGDVAFPNNTEKKLLGVIDELLSTVQKSVDEELPAGGKLLLKKMTGWNFFKALPEGILSTELPIQKENFIAIIGEQQVNFRVISPVYKEAETKFVKKGYKKGAAELGEVFKDNTHCSLVSSYFRVLENDTTMLPKLKVFKALQDFFRFPELFLFIEYTNKKNEENHPLNEQLLPVWCVKKCEKRTDNWKPENGPWEIKPDTGHMLIHVQNLMYRTGSSENWQKITDYESGEALPHRTPLQFAQRHKKKVIELELIKVSEDSTEFPGSFKAEILTMPESLPFQPDVKVRTDGKEKKGTFIIGLRRCELWKIESPWDWINLLIKGVNQLLVDIDTLKDILTCFNQKDYLYYAEHQVVIDSFNKLKVGASREWIGHGKTRTLNIGKRIDLYLEQDNEERRVPSILLAWVLFSIINIATPLNSHTSLYLHINGTFTTSWCSLDNNEF
jgi:hypothetical protein